MPAAHIEPVAGAGHGDVKLAVIFVGLGLAHLVLGVVDDVEARGPGEPDEMADLARSRACAGKRVEAHPLPARQGAGVRQEHDRRLQAFGAMDRHDAHLVALLLHVALDLEVAQAKRVDEALQRRRRLAVIGERQIEKLIERLGSLWPQPGQHALAHLLAGLAEQLEEELVRRNEVDAAEPAREAA